MLTVKDLAPVIVAGVMAVHVLFLTWLAYRQAHSGDRIAGGRKAEAGE